MEAWKEEVRQTEAAFASMALEKGIATAFLYYAADDAVLNRNDSLIIGIENIQKRFDTTPAPAGELSWSPDFIEVSESGDLAYTYGQYEYKLLDSAGTEVIHTGIFHTVWQRQADGSWKYVWD